MLITASSPSTTQPQCMELHAEGCRCCCIERWWEWADALVVATSRPGIEADWGDDAAFTGFRFPKRK